MSGLICGTKSFLAQRSNLRRKKTYALFVKMDEEKAVVDLKTICNTICAILNEYARMSK